jgi:hypothetical protein
MNTDPQRNKPNDTDRKNDPELRDESAFQPGVSTVSSSSYDDDNEKLTDTAADDFREEKDSGAAADPTYDQIDKD